ncbi:protein of unknown function [Tenacibaculum maritimum NCIMB 2154]|uniref:Uncharacterized protein n=1 Tax=Tenacibaculum maritimum NCIMB 2154 TaxID=1349785 RepID=A0A2H1EBA3_9FLAO|nr:protein of unknown function [Tenacibaculum maritimum NCIMB 2154]
MYSVFTREKSTVQKTKLKSCTVFLREKKIGYRKRSSNLVACFYEKKKRCTEKVGEKIYTDKYSINEKRNYNMLCVMMLNIKENNFYYFCDRFFVYSFL